MQVHRVGAAARSRPVTVKRVAIATRWGSGRGGAADARLSVRDPVEEGEPITPDDKDSLFIGVLRLHVANLLEPLGYAEFPSRMRDLITAPFIANERAAQTRLRQLFDSMVVRDVGGSAAPILSDPLVGGVVTRAALLTAPSPPRSTRRRFPAWPFGPSSSGSNGAWWLLPSPVTLWRRAVDYLAGNSPIRRRAAIEAGHGLCPSTAPLF
jgi:hypothetical protein